MLREKWLSLVVGQEQFIDAVEPAIQRYQAELADPYRPVGSWLLAGPTGSGKTKAVQALAEALHGSVKLIRVDCAEFSQKHEVSKLIGAPPGYLGHRETQPVLTQAKLASVTSEGSPLSVVLFDEAEKADPDLYMLLYGVMDHGELRLGDNTVVGFGNSLIFFTSNLAEDKIKRATLPPMGFASADRLARTQDHRGVTAIARRATQDGFPTAFVNRLDGVIGFGPLSREDARQVTELELAAATKRARRFTLEIDPKVGELILEEGYSLEYGAREIKRVIERRVMNRLANEIADLDKTNLKVRVEVANGEIAIRTWYGEARKARKVRV